MRAAQHRLAILRPLLLAATVAAFAFAAVADAQAQRRGFGGGGGGFGAGGFGGGGLRMGGSGHGAQFGRAPRGESAVRPNHVGKVGHVGRVGQVGRGDGRPGHAGKLDHVGKPGRVTRPTDGSRPPHTGRPGKEAGHWDRPHRPRDPKRPPRPWRPHNPGFGVVTGVATGVALGATAVHAATPPPPPPGYRASPPPPRVPRGVAFNVPPQGEQRFVPDEVVLEFANAVSPTSIGALAARHRLAALELLALPSTGTVYFRGRITDGRSVSAVLRALGSESSVRAGQPNYLYRFAQQRDPAPLPRFVPPTPPIPDATAAAATAAAIPSGGDPAQYMLGKLRVHEAHGLARGGNVLIAVIDSGVDASHPELGGVIAGQFDALGTGLQPHSHGTGIAGAIAARAKLMGVAPNARILAIRAFGDAGTGHEATTFAILKSVDHAIGQGARVINMSFAGPRDPGLGRQLQMARGRGVVLIAAAGNLGPKSGPQFPAADPNVIAVSATDADDRLFGASNRGQHISVAAPGVDILLPTPQAGYELMSGTSFAAAHVSGVAALILERKPGLSPDNVRRILQTSAKDLGPRGKDELFGAGLANAYQAILATEPQTAAVPSPQAAR